MQIPCIFELDENSEATGKVHMFCCDECRRKGMRAFTSDEVAQADSHLDDFPDNAVCEWCDSYPDDQSQYDEIESNLT